MFVWAARWNAAGLGQNFEVCGWKHVVILAMQYSLIKVLRKERCRNENPLKTSNYNFVHGFLLGIVISRRTSARQHTTIIFKAEHSFLYLLTSRQTHNAFFIGRLLEVKNWKLLRLNSWTSFEWDWKPNIYVHCYPTFWRHSNRIK